MLWGLFFPSLHNTSLHTPNLVWAAELQFWGELCWQAQVKPVAKPRGGSPCPSIEIKPVLLPYKSSLPQPLLGRCEHQHVVLIYLLALLVKLPSLHPYRGLTFPFIGCQHQILTFGALLSRSVWSINTCRPQLLLKWRHIPVFISVSKQRLQRWLLKLCS